jgi:predicted AlkP superfamily pyrophosphatase or phosphodiesterase
MKARALFLSFWIVCISLAWGAPADHVVIVSIDGGRPDVILASDTPNLHEMARTGAWTWRAETVDPSLTLVAHSSMLSGCQPGKHRILWNDWEPKRGFIQSATCFEIAHAAGMRTAMFVAKRKLEHIAKPKTVDQFATVEGGAPAVARVAADYVRKNKPNLLLVHFTDPDTAGHAHHWGSPEQRGAVEACDRGIGILREAVKDADISEKTLFIVTADHGGHLNTHGTTDARDMTIPWIACGSGITKPHQIEEPVSVCDTAPTAVCALGLKPDPQWDGKALTGLFAIEKPSVAK